MAHPSPSFKPVSGCFHTKTNLKVLVFLKVSFGLFNEGTSVKVLFIGPLLSNLNVYSLFHFLPHQNYAEPELIHLLGRRSSLSIMKASQNLSCRNSIHLFLMISKNFFSAFSHLLFHKSVV